MSRGEPTGWITVRGNRVPLFEGESKSDAVKRFAEERKNKAISKNKKTGKENAKAAKEEKLLKNYSKLGISKADLSKADVYHIKLGESLRDMKTADKMLEKIKSGDFKKVAVVSGKKYNKLILSNENGKITAQYLHRPYAQGPRAGFYSDGYTTGKKTFKTARGAEDFVAYFYSIGKYKKK